MFRRREDPRIAELQNEVNRLTNDINKYKDWVEGIQRSATKCSASVDFNTLNAFSIERMVKDHGPCTIIGYYPDPNEKSKEKVKEWYIYCDDAVHENLVKQFNQAKGL